MERYGTIMRALLAAALLSTLAGCETQLSRDEATQNAEEDALERDDTRSKQPAGRYGLGLTGSARAALSP
ncbi:hypothetical protein [Isoalcanivorax indicus]|uniref:hypothetical protein n=1 Tax=Isoalcanivorax indicus TaxID=2202653 RepID=UPI000DBA0A08|nr:hypothetical protein [Isoalcanivorax indicus]